MLAVQSVLSERCRYHCRNQAHKLLRSFTGRENSQDAQLSCCRSYNQMLNGTTGWSVGPNSNELQADSEACRLVMTSDRPKNIALEMSFLYGIFRKIDRVRFGFKHEEAASIIGPWPNEAPCCPTGVAALVTNISAENSFPAVISNHAMQTLLDHQWRCTNSCFLFCFVRTRIADA